MKDRGKGHYAIKDPELIRSSTLGSDLRWKNAKRLRSEIEKFTQFRNKKKNKRERYKTLSFFPISFRRFYHRDRFFFIIGWGEISRFHDRVLYFDYRNGYSCDIHNPRSSVGAKGISKEVWPNDI